MATLRMVNDLAQTENAEATVTLPYFGDCTIKPTISREHYEHALAPWNEAIADLVYEATRQAGWNPEHVDVLIVNGSAAAHPSTLEERYTVSAHKPPFCPKRGTA